MPTSQQHVRQNDATSRSTFYPTTAHSNTNCYEPENEERKELTSGTHKSKQEVEAEKRELGSGSGFGDEVEETQVREERGGEELRGYALGIDGGRPRVHRQEPPNEKRRRP